MTAPTGCTLVGARATCDFSSWSPPLVDSDFSKSPSQIYVENINGVIPSNSFYGLTNADNDAGSQMSLTCSFANSWTLELLSDSITSNLSWVGEMSISDCYSMTIASGALSALTGATILTFLAGSFTSLSGSAFSGMTSLQTMYMYANMPLSGVPAGLFSGLTSLQTLDMSRTPLYSLPSGAFNDLTSLTTLILEETGLTTLPSDLFTPLTSLTSLNLDYNNWTCDCSLEWLATYLTSTSLTTTTCYLPANFAGSDLQTSIQSLTCTATTAASASGSSSSDNDDWAWWVYTLIAVGSLAVIAAAVACICCCCFYGKNCKRRHKDPEDNKKTTDNKKANKNTNDETNPRSKHVDKVVKNKFSGNTGSLPAVEQTIPTLNLNRPIKNKALLSTNAGLEVSTPRSTRSGKVTPTNVKPLFKKTSLAERRENIQMF